MNDWTTQHNRLCKTFKFATFADAMTFMLRVSYIAEEMDHHPEWKNVYNTVFVELTTHSATAITDLDHQLAASMDTVHAKMIT